MNPFKAIYQAAQSLVDALHRLANAINGAAEQVEDRLPKDVEADVVRRLPKK